MSDDDPPHRLRWPRVLGRLAGYTLLAAGLYLFGIGPAIYLFGARSARAEQALRTVLAPAMELDTRLFPAQRPLWHYMTWWAGLPFGPYDRINRGEFHAPK